MDAMNMEWGVVPTPVDVYACRHCDTCPQIYERDFANLRSSPIPHRALFLFFNTFRLALNLRYRFAVLRARESGLRPKGAEMSLGAYAPVACCCSGCVSTHWS